MKQTKSLAVIVSLCLAFSFCISCNSKKEEKKEEPKTNEVAPAAKKMDTIVPEPKPTSPGN